MGLFEGRRSLSGGEPLSQRYPIPITQGLLPVVIPAYRQRRIVVEEPHHRW